MSTLTDSGVIQEVIAELYTGDEPTLAGAGYVKRLMIRVIEGTLPKTLSRLGGRGKIIASVPNAIMYPTTQIVTPVDSEITVPATETYGSFGEITIDSVAAGDGNVIVDGCWNVVGVSDLTITDPVVTTITVSGSAVSSGALTVDTSGQIRMFGLWTLT